MYGTIVANISRQGGGDISTPHRLGNIASSGYCSFLLQDITLSGVVRVLPRVYTKTYGATNVTFRDNTVAGEATFSALLVAPHSYLDAGPIATGATRTLVRRYHTPSYRSLHASVQFDIVAGQNTCNVLVTHNLGLTDACKDNCIAIVSPDTDPYDAAVVQPPTPAALLRVHTSNYNSGNSLTLTMTRDDLQSFNFNATHYWDVMVITYPLIGHSMPYLGGGDYAVPADIPVLPQIPSYKVGYFNVDGVTANNYDLVHNLNGAARHLLFAYEVAPGAQHVYIVNNNFVAGTTAHIGDAAQGIIDDMKCAVFRNYSVHVPQWYDFANP